jgi:predicted ferric reductase
MVAYNEGMPAAKAYSSKTRFLLGMLIVLLAIALLAGGWIIPFKYPSFSILYKFGKLKQFLRYGKVIGISVVLLLFFQVVLATRLKFFERVFSAKTLFFLHRLNGFIITCVVVAHPVLIKASDNFIPYTISKKYYPEFVGMGLIFVLLTVSLAAIFRKFFNMPYARWRLLHRMGATLVLAILPFHVLLVSTTFKSAGVPRYGAIIVFSLNLLFILYIWLRRIFYR